MRMGSAAGQRSAAAVAMVPSPDASGRDWEFEEIADVLGAKPSGSIGPNNIFPLKLS